MPSVTRQTNKPAAASASNNGQATLSAWDLLGKSRSWLFYGDTGSGKTTLWGSFPSPIRCLICSGGTLPGELLSLDSPENRKRIRPVVIESSEQLGEEIKGEAGTWVLDHLSGLSTLLLKEHLGLSDLPAVLKWGMATQADYGNVNEKCIELLRAFLSLHGEVVIVAQERIFKGKDDRVESDIIKPVVGPAVTPGVCTWLAPACSYVIQTFKRARMKQQNVEGVAISTREKGVEYCARLEAHDTFITKFRLHGRVPPDVLVLGDSVNGVDKKQTGFQQLLKVIQGGK
mgnify:CR=1 FL=1